jgi:hypothetical protein
MPGGVGPGARALLARAAGADVRARVALKAAIDDAFLTPDARLDDKSRAALTGLIQSLADTIEGELREHAMRLLAGRGEGALAEMLGTDRAPLIDRLAGAGLLRDADLFGECIARVRCELIAAALPAEAPGDPDTPSLLVRLIGSSDRVVATAASAVMSGESQRRAIGEGGSITATGLPPELHQRLLWWIAAALRERAAPAAEAGLPALDRAIAEAALRNVAANDGSDRLEAAAMRLAQAIDAQPDELATLLDEALRDRRVTLLVALIAHALGVSYELARELVLEPSGDRLWLALRGLELPRSAIARIGYRLCEADSRRDLDVFADTLDAVAGIDGATARAAIAPLTLHPDYRAALLALGGT